MSNFNRENNTNRDFATDASKSSTLHVDGTSTANSISLSTEDELMERVFGHPADSQTVVNLPLLRSKFSPWHHPVKQIVRDYQWADQAKRLLGDYRTDETRKTLTYFTLPGSDLLDVRVLSEALRGNGTKIDYFGFDTGYNIEVEEHHVDESGTYLSAESALRQAGLVTDDAEILPDRLEDIAVPSSHAASRLRQRGCFDIVNIDACSHLGYKPPGRGKSIFDALEALMAHQLKSDKVWLLMVTTRANTEVLAGSVDRMKHAIHNNIKVHKEFCEALAQCWGGDPVNLPEDMETHWSNQSLEFLKLFCVGLGKHLLHFYHAQQNLPAKVKLVSAFAYKVSADLPDMLSMTFRISPAGLQIQPASAGGNVAPLIELGSALAIVEKANAIWDLDEAISTDPEVRRDAVEGTVKLLQTANFDVSSWKEWLRNHKIRPIDLEAAA